MSEAESSSHFAGWSIAGAWADRIRGYMLHYAPQDSVRVVRYFAAPYQRGVPLRLRACKHRALRPDCSQITEHPSQVSAPLVLGFDLANATRMKRVWCVHATATRTNRASLSIIMVFSMNLATQLRGCCLGRV